MVARRSAPTSSSRARPTGASPPADHRRRDVRRCAAAPVVQAGLREPTALLVRAGAPSLGVGTTWMVESAPRSRSPSSVADADGPTALPRPALPGLTCWAPSATCSGSRCSWSAARSAGRVVARCWLRRWSRSAGRRHDALLAVRSADVPGAGPTGPGGRPRTQVAGAASGARCGCSGSPPIGADRRWTRATCSTVLAVSPRPTMRRAQPDGRPAARRGRRCVAGGLLEPTPCWSARVPRSPAPCSSVDAGAGGQPRCHVGALRRRIGDAAPADRPLYGCSARRGSRSTPTALCSPTPRQRGRDRRLVFDAVELCSLAVFVPLATLVGRLRRPIGRARLIDGVWTIAAAPRCARTSPRPVRTLARP